MAPSPGRIEAAQPVASGRRAGGLRRRRVDPRLLDDLQPAEVVGLVGSQLLDHQPLAHAAALELRDAVVAEGVVAGAGRGCSAPSTSRGDMA